MAMQVSTLDILIEKGHFEPKVARAVAEAIENESQQVQAVTVPVLDARLADLRSDLVRWVFTAVMSQMAVTLGFMYFMLQHVR